MSERSESAKRLDECAWDGPAGMIPPWLTDEAARSYAPRNPMPEELAEWKARQAAWRARAIAAGKPVLTFFD